MRSIPLDVISQSSTASTILRSHPWLMESTVSLISDLVPYCTDRDSVQGLENLVTTLQSICRPSTIPDQNGKDDCSTARGNLGVSLEDHSTVGPGSLGLPCMDGAETSADGVEVDGVVNEERPDGLEGEAGPEHGHATDLQSTSCRVFDTKPHKLVFDDTRTGTIDSDHSYNDASDIAHSSSVIHPPSRSHNISTAPPTSSSKTLTVREQTIGFAARKSYLYNGVVQLSHRKVSKSRSLLSAHHRNFKSKRYMLTKPQRH